MKNIYWPGFNTVSWLTFSSIGLLLSFNHHRKPWTTPMKFWVDIEQRRPEPPTDFRNQISRNEGWAVSTALVTTSQLLPTILNTEINLLFSSESSSNASLRFVIFLLRYVETTFVRLTMQSMKVKISSVLILVTVSASESDRCYSHIMSLRNVMFPLIFRAQTWCQNSCTFISAHQICIILLQVSINS